jgi:hypothetical protein
VRRFVQRSWRRERGRAMRPLVGGASCHGYSAAMEWGGEGGSLAAASAASTHLSSPPCFSVVVSLFSPSQLAIALARSNPLMELDGAGLCLV